MLRKLLPLLPGVLLLSGFALGFVHTLGLFIGVLYIAWTLFAERHLPWPVWWTVSLLASFALAAHLLPGSESWTLWPSRQLSSDAPAYALRLSWDKALVGATLLVWWLRRPPPTSRSMDYASIAVICTLFAVPLLAIASGLVVWKPKWPEGLWIWMLMNLTVISLTEECIFRGLLQTVLVQRFGALVGILVASVLFGLAHLPFSGKFALVAGIAGLGYGLALHFSGRMSMAVLLHAAVNSVHLLLLSYPLHLGLE
ncbi:abortive infection protein [Pseudomonas knackmussii B13]|uniref:Abortive infection protein n=1 Tax=Pseudomonas knackmussii (strain DSM 6978 / CCUG 54928 / LMG 23759 / B13) TaxID=1301098 RepID=A0A024HKJ4_PSEKB|nr:CPBP family intramembrane glutamic endopeptidase [Pseudomonas knackmussii]CDF85037.1 abortive infection protein [Pseudomonas knackmussii B13]